MALMQIKGLEKSYPGKKVLHGVDMEIPAGKIIGLLGPNSSGKTTLLKTIAGLLSPDAGTIVYPGNAAWGVESKSVVSFLPDQIIYPSWMRPRDAFVYFSKVFPDYSPTRANSLIKLLDIPMETPIRKLSKGMVERVSLALAFSRDAKVFLLDEPLGGIDPVGKAKVLESILSVQGEDTTILLSTHLVKDIETVIDSFMLLSEGKIIHTGDCEQLRAEQGKTVEDVYMEVFANAITI